MSAHSRTCGREGQPGMHAVCVASSRDYSACSSAFEAIWNEVYLWPEFSCPAKAHLAKAAS